MRLQKIVIISALAGLSVTPAYSQTDRKPSGEFSRVDSTQNATDAKLAEILRKKQAELDAMEQSGRGLKPMPAAKTIQPKAGSSATSDGLEEALRRKQAELDAGANPGRRMESPTAPTTRTSPRPMVSQTPVDSAADQRLVEALRKKQTELDSMEHSVTGSSKDAYESDKRIQRMEAEIKAKEEAIRKRATTPQKPGVTSAAEVSAQKAQALEAATKATPAKSSSKNVSQWPVSDLTTKEGRLADLLRRYKADAITPKEYHLERAKIIAEP